MTQICPNCKHEEIPGSIFCSECGASLSDSDDTITNAFPSPFKGTPAGMDRIPADCLSEGSYAALYIPGYAGCLNFHERRTYIVGRTAEGKGASPDVDLADYEGYQNGVSRVHASLVIEKEAISVQDLDSANGTHLNDRRLIPRVPYPVRNGDRLVFGKLQTRMILRN